MKCAVAITTYNRPDMLCRLLEQIEQEASLSKIDTSIHVFDDASRIPVTETDTVSVYRSPKNRGKKGHWKTVNHIFSVFSELDFAYCYILPDDIELVPSFFDISISTFEAITDPNKICLNLSLDQREGQPCWTGYIPTIESFDGIEVWQSGWVDLCLIANRSFLKALEYRINPIPLTRWELNPRLSSGVGQQISQRLYPRYHMYQVRKTLIRHGRHLSVMHPELRVKQPLHTKD